MGNVSTNGGAEQEGRKIGSGEEKLMRVQSQCGNHGAAGGNITSQVEKGVAMRTGWYCKT